MKKIIAFIKKKPAPFIATLALVAVAVLGVIFYPQIKDTFLDKGDESVVSESEITSNNVENDINLINNEVILSRDLSKSIVASVKATNAVSENDFLIETNSSLVLNTTEDISADELEKIISSSADIPFKITKSADKEFNLSYDSELKAGSLIKLVEKNNSGKVVAEWAFQTKDIFKIVHTYPAHGGTYVPVDTGIEIQFTELVNINDFSNHFEITPKVEGKFARFSKTLTFIPDDGFEPNTIYQVKLKDGLKAASGNILKSGKEFAFKTNNYNNNNYCYINGLLTETFIPGEPTLLEIRSSVQYFDKDFDVKIYQYKNADEYREALEKNLKGEIFESDYIYETNGLSSIFDSKVKLQRAGDAYEWSPSFLLLPDDLEEGWYLVDVKAEAGNTKVHLQKHIQMSTVSVFAATLPNEVAYFINDTNTGKPHNEAEIIYSVNGDDKTAKTDSNGTAKLSIFEENDGAGILTINTGNKIYIDRVDYRQRQNRDPREDYYLYIYTDREAYLSTDSVNVYGAIMLRPDSKIGEIPKDLTLSFVTNDVEYEPIKVNLNPDGTFTGTLSFENVQESWYTFVQLKSGDDIIANKRIVIQDYVKPVYRVEMDIPKYMWLPDLNVPVKADVAFYDGTPAKDVEIKFNDVVTAVSDDEGHIETKVSYIDESNSWYPQYFSVSHMISGVENEFSNGYRFMYMYNRDATLKHNFDAETNTFSVETAKIDKEKIPNNTSYNAYEGNTFDNLKGDNYDTTVKAVLKREWYERNETGTYYDFIQKKTIKKYEYGSRQTKTIESYEINTIDGKGVIENLPINEENSGYYIELSWFDSRGKLVEETVYLWHSWYRMYDSDARYYNLKANSNSFKENEVLTFDLQSNYEPVKEKGGRIFYAFSTSEFLSLNVADSTIFTHKMTSNYIPIVHVSAAYFDGKHVYPVQYYDALRFDPSEREVILDVDTDKEKYTPGENVTLSLKATDLNGKTVANAAVSMSLVDEAAFAIMEQDVDILDSIYDNFYVPYPSYYHSYIQHTVYDNGAGEKGGGDGDNIGPRQDFKDTAAFLIGTTDENGFVEFTLKLPDNITTWRATAQAIYKTESGSILAGVTKTPVVATLPFFLTTINSTRFVVGDSIAFSARAIGNDAKNIIINAEVTSDEKGFTTLKASAKSDEPLEFGKLPKGNYQILFSANNGEHSDSVKYDFEVVDTLIETPVTKTFSLADEIPEITSSRFPVTMMFYNGQYRLYGDVLDRLYCSWGSRAEFQISNAFAAREFGYLNDKEYVERLSNITENGGAKIYAYAETDLELTALVAVAAPEIINSFDTARFFTEKLMDYEITPSEIADCYLGLAALNKPVLTDIRTLLNEVKEFSDNDKLKLTAALALLGDRINAHKYYLNITDNMKVSSIINAAGREEITAYLDFGSPEENIKHSSTALITASILDLPEADGLVRYLLTHKSRLQTIELQLITYLSNYVPDITDEAVFAYNYKDKIEEVKIDRHNGVRISFSKDSFEHLNLELVSGDVICKAFYTGNISDFMSEGTMNVTKTITPKGNDNAFKLGGLAEVEIIIAGSSSGSYVINDVVPSGARFVKATTGYVDDSGQSLKCYINNSKRVKYLIRFVTPGEYVLESAVAVYSDESWGSSERQMIMVEK